MTKLVGFSAACAAVLLAFSASAYDVNPGNADDAAAINAAIAAAAAEGGSGKVTLAGGTYFLTTPVTLNAAVELVGNDADRKAVVFDGYGNNRILDVTHNDAIAHGITFVNGYSDLTDNWAHGPVYVTAGTISNCVHHAGRGRYAGALCLNPTANGAEAYVKDTLIYDCNGSDGGGAGIGGGLRIIGTKPAVADRCTIWDCADGNYAGVYINSASGKLLNSTITNCTKVGVSMVANGLVSNCVIRACSRSGNGGGIYMENGTVMDTLVTGCTGTTGGGVWKKGGTLRNCTVVGNTATSSAPGVYQSGGSIASCILWNNGSTIYQTSEASLVLAGGSCTYTCAAAAPAGNGNINNWLPAFADAANGDYTLSVASPCRGAGEDGVDMGYRQYEAPAAARCSFSYVFAEGKAPAEVTFTAALEGEYGAVTGYGWDFGDGSAADMTSGATATHVFQSAGRYTVTLTVVTSAGTLTYAVPNAVNLGSDEVYVSPSGTGSFPYATPETACSDIQTAIDAVIASEDAPGKVYLAESASPYKLGNNSRFTISRPVEVIGAGPGKSIIDCEQKSGKTGFLLQHEKAVVSSLTVYRGQWPSNVGGGGANIEAGTITNCVFDTCKGAYNGSVYLSNAKSKLVDCVVRGGYFSDGGGAGNGGGIYMTQGLVSGCVVTNCSGGSAGGGIYAKGGTITNTLVRGCKITGGSGMGGGLFLEGATAIDMVVTGCSMTKNGGSGGGGVYIKSGTLDASVVTNNSCSYVSGGGVYMINGTLSRTVVAENSVGANGGGVYISGGTMDHCTVARNNAGTDGSGVLQAGGTVKNSIVAANGYQVGKSLTQLVKTAGTTTCTCAAGLEAADGNISDDPKFRAPEVDDFRLLSSSPCRGTAENGEDMGAIPYVSDPTAVTVALSVSVDGQLYPVTADFAVEVDGTMSSPVVSYEWTLGDGEVVTTTENSLRYVYEACGTYTVSVVLHLENGTDWPAVVKQNAVSAYSNVAYVNAASENPVPPYETPEKAARTIDDTLGVVFIPEESYATIYVEAGDYELTKTTEWILSRNIHIQSRSGLRDVYINGKGKSFHIQSGADGVVLSGLVISNAAPYGTAWGVFDFSKGTLTNCAAIKCSGGFAGGAHVAGTSKVIDCLFDGCSSYDSNGGGSHSLGAFLVKESGFADRCVVTNCSGANNGAVQVDGGTLSRTAFYGNTGSGRTVVQTGGMVDSCVIVGNKSNGATGNCVGIYTTGGTVRNCLVAGNTASAGGYAGIRTNNPKNGANSSVIENCTITANHGSHAGAISVDTTTWRNCVSFGNDGADSLGNATCTACLFGRDPMFADAANGDYRLTGASPCVDGGMDVAWGADGVDLDGNERVVDGNGDGEAAIDIGAYEYDPAKAPPGCSFEVTDGAYSLSVPLTASFKAHTQGAVGTVNGYIWDFGDGTCVTSATDTVSHEYTEFGVRTVSLTLDCTGGDVPAFTTPGAVSIKSTVAYVSLTGSDTAPYETPEKATPDLNAAIEAVADLEEGLATVHVATGTYVRATSAEIIVAKAVRIVGDEGAERTIVDGNGKQAMLLRVRHEDAIVEGITFDGRSSCRVAQLENGTIRNCVLTGGNHVLTGGILMTTTKGVLENSVIRNSTSYDPGGATQYANGGFYISGGTMRGCVISNCAATCQAAGIIEGGTVSNCTFVSNQHGGGQGSGVVRIISGTLSNSRIVGNYSKTSTSGVAGLFASAGTVRNCLIADNSSMGAVGLKVDSAIVESCTVAGNVSGGEGYVAGVTCTGAANLINVLVWGNVGTTTNSLGSVTCTACLFDRDPKFRNPARGDYRFRGGSPAQNAGTYRAWMDGATDLNGNPRILNKKVDIGCFEVPETGMTLIVR